MVTYHPRTRQGGEMADGDAVAKLRRKIDDELASNWAAWPGGWPDEIEVALIDAVFSIQASYTGVRNVVGRWRAHRGAGRLDDLSEVTSFVNTPQEFMTICDNAQMVPSRSSTKAEAVLAAATRLAGLDVYNAADLDTTKAEHRDAYVGVKGLGEVTWQYLGMLLGKPGVKADTMIRRFVAASQGRSDTSAHEARIVVEAAAAKMNCSATDLDHAIWSHQRRK